MYMGTIIINFMIEAAFGSVENIKNKEGHSEVLNIVILSFLS